MLMILVSKFMLHRALSDKTYLSLGLLSPLKNADKIACIVRPVKKDWAVLSKGTPMDISI